VTAGAEVPFVVKLVGFAGQGLFAARMLAQWIASERARKSVVPRSFWKVSLIASLMILVYALWLADGVFVLGTLANTFVYLRNLSLSSGVGRAPARKRILIPIAATVCVFLVLAVTEKVDFSESPLWLVIGLTGSTVWVFRFAIQWWVSERRGLTVVPRSFWICSLVGNCLLLAYAIHAGDVVFILAYLPGPLIYARNLVLMRSEAAAAELPRIDR
jgi:lipid-A-disaccharide synthase-like uncharacterized protein